MQTQCLFSRRVWDLAQLLRPSPRDAQQRQLTPGLQNFPSEFPTVSVTLRWGQLVEAKSWASEKHEHRWFSGTNTAAGSLKKMR